MAFSSAVCLSALASNSDLYHNKNMEVWEDIDWMSLKNKNKNKYKTGCRDLGDGFLPDKVTSHDYMAIL